MTGYTFAVTCPKCGGAVDHVNGAHPGPNLAHAVVRCPACAMSYHLHLEMLLVGRDPR